MSKIWDALQKVERNREYEPGTPTELPYRVQLTPKQMAAVHGLLATDSLTKAAEISGVKERTLRKWLEQPSFVAAYYAAGRAQLAQSLQRLRAMTGSAVDVLRIALEDDDPMVRIRAAAAILNGAALDQDGVAPACAANGGDVTSEES
jgi:hypothetical protein